jgi:iron complex outermembrane receptor protein
MSALCKTFALATSALAAVLCIQRADAQTASPGLDATAGDIIVTAQKREQRLLDVPAPVTALSAAGLADTSKVRIQDFYQSVPGLNIAVNDFDGAPIINIRGITTGGSTNPTVGITIDDVPLNASSALAGGEIVPDFDPSDLQRIEVLRGPQGTLYGASSLGGLIKFVTVDPSTTRLSGRIQAGLNGIAGGSVGYNGSAGLNLPLSDDTAASISGFGRRDSGYIDNVLTGQKDVNSRTSYGAHGSILWRPTTASSIKLGAFYQDSRAHGSSVDDAGLGLADLQQRQVRDTGKYHRSTALFSAIGKTEVGRFALVSITGYSVNHLTDRYDGSRLLGGLPAALYGAAATGAVITNRVRTEKFNEELRLSTSFGKTFDWVIGGFYTHEKTSSLQSIFAANAASGAFAGSLVDADDFPSKYQEYAIFTDLTVHVTDRFQLQLGVRESHNDQSYHETIVGADTLDLEGAPSPIVQPNERSHDNSFTFLVTPQYKLSNNVMIYARIASGYRPGGPNVIATVFNIPSTYKADRTVNYEIGSKGTLLGGKLTFDVSLYDIAWKDIQLLLLDANGNGFFANANRARSRGIELATEIRPAAGLTLSGYVTYGKAELTENVPVTASIYGAAGDQLPFSGKLTGNIAGEQRVDVGADTRLFLGGEFSYVDERKGTFRGTAVRQIYPSYTKMDLHARLVLKSWTANLYVNNVTNKRGILSGGIGSLDKTGFTYIQPRTIGLSLARTF